MKKTSVFGVYVCVTWHLKSYSNIGHPMIIVIHEALNADDFVNPRVLVG